MMKVKLTLLSIVLCLITALSYGQSGVEMADVMRSNGKIYVVVTVVTVILLGILVYLITIDRKLTSIEKKLKK